MYTFVFFLCINQSLATEVALSSDMIYGLSPLPPGCYWTNGDKPQIVLVERENVDQIRLQNGDLVDIAYVRIGSGAVGYSAGYSTILG